MSCCSAALFAVDFTCSTCRRSASSRVMRTWRQRCTFAASHSIPSMRSLPSTFGITTMRLIASAYSPRCPRCSTLSTLITSRVRWRFSGIQMARCSALVDDAFDLHSGATILRVSLRRKPSRMRTIRILSRSSPRLTTPSWAVYVERDISSHNNAFVVFSFYILFITNLIKFPFFSRSLRLVQTRLWLLATAGDAQLWMNKLVKLISKKAFVL